MSRINKFIEGNIPKDSYDIPSKKIKKNKKSSIDWKKINKK